MNRRELLKRTLQVGMTTSAAIAVATQINGKPAFGAARDKLADGFAKMEKRIDKLERHQRKLLRVGAIAFAVSTGVDLSILL